MSISIHILHAEDDLLRVCLLKRRHWISIHILHAEDDVKALYLSNCSQGFQSTSSMRRMTAKTAKIILIQNNFLTIFTKNNLSHY